MTTAVWVVGATGQLGTALLQRLGQRSAVTIVRYDIRWDDTESSIHDLTLALDGWLATPDATCFELYWAAGSAITSTSAGAVAQEIAVFEHFLDAFARAVELARPIDVALFFASSAGGLYSGSNSGPPFHEDAEVAPVTPYGEAKLAMETAVRRTAVATGTKLLIGRISTLYGAGQRIAKAQGFVSQLCRSYIVRQPLGVYVSLDTMRDYVHADDAASVIVAATLRRANEAAGGDIVVKNIASHAPMTLGEVIHQARLVFKRAPSLVLATSALAGGQVRDLRIGSSVWPDLNDLPRRPFVVGLAQTRASLERQMRAGGL